MALSGTFTQGFTNNGAFRLRLVWSATQDISGNYSTVWADLYIDSLQSWASVSDATSSACNININGNNKSFSNTSTLNGNQSKKLGSHSATIYHNADGTKQFTISASHNFDITWNGAYVGNVSVSGNASLNTIPRATTPTLSNSNPIMGDTITINLPRASSSFTHYVYHDFHAGSWTQINSTAVATSLNWTVPLALYAERIPNAVSGGGRIKVDTYNGGTYIGSKIVNFTARVPASAMPSITSTSISEAVSGLHAKFGAYVQSKSKLALTMAGAGIYKSTIASYKITANGTNYNANSATTSELNASGTQGVTFSLTDSRGRTVSVTTQINVVAYFSPRLTVLTASRCLADGTPDDEGEFAKVTIAAEIAPVGNLNDKTYKVSKKTVTSEIWTETDISGDYTLSAVTILSDISGNNAWDIKLTVADYFSSASKTMQLSTAFSLIDYFNGGKGLAFGKVAEKEGFENNLKTWFTGGVEAIPLPSGEGNLLYWQGVLGGYYHAVLGSVAGQPSPSGLVHVIRHETDFSVIWHDLTSRNVYRLYGSAAAINGWTLISGTPVTFSPTLLSGWVNYGDGFATAGFSKGPDNRVHLTGLIKGGTVADGTVIFTLPDGFRPAQKETFIVFISGGGFGRVDVNDNGSVVAKIVNATYTSLGGISFLANN
jgi:hypothetical protein